MGGRGATFAFAKGRLAARSAVFLRGAAPEELRAAGAEPGACAGRYVAANSVSGGGQLRARRERGLGRGFCISRGSRITSRVTRGFRLRRGIGVRRWRVAAPPKVGLAVYHLGAEDVRVAAVAELGAAQVIRARRVVEVGAASDILSFCEPEVVFEVML